MKKKIGELTYREITEICRKYRNCKDCPFLISYKEKICLIRDYWPRAVCEKILNKEIDA